jgi:hypothetical protein
MKGILIGQNPTAISSPFFPTSLLDDPSGKSDSSGGRMKKY